MAYIWLDNPRTTNMKKVSDILLELESDKGRLFKIDVLKQNSDNTLWKRVVKAALDPYTQYYIKKIPPFIFQVMEYKQSLEWALDELQALSSREYTGNKAKTHLTYILENLSNGNADVIIRVITKDLKCGVNVGTINASYGKGFIEKYPCMLASVYNEKNLKNIIFPALAQTKMDGMRANIIMDSEDNKIEIRSRNGKTIELHGVFDDYVKTMFYKTPSVDDLSAFHSGVIDGELVVLNDDMNEILDRKTGNGILNKAVKGTISKEEALRVRMVAWDLIPLNDFKNGESKIPYFDRLEVLGIRMTETHNVSEVGSLIKIVGTMPVDDIDQANELFQAALADGEEGIILKNGDSPWEDKRSKYQVKMKAELEADLLVIDWIEGHGRLKGMMGSVTCQSADKLLEVNVGSGFNDEDRKMNPDDIIGKIITVKYNEIIQDKKKKKKSLFLPIFQEIRLDKSKADIL